MIGLSSQRRFFQGERYNVTLGGGPSIPVRYGGLYNKYSIFRLNRIRTNCRLGGDRSIQLSYGGIYRNYSILQGSRIRTIRFLGGVCSIQLSYWDVFNFLSVSVMIGPSSQLSFFQGERCNVTLAGGHSIPLSYGDSYGASIAQTGAKIKPPQHLPAQTLPLQKRRPSAAYRRRPPAESGCRRPPHNSRPRRSTAAGAAVAFCQGRVIPRTGQ